MSVPSISKVFPQPLLIFAKLVPTNVEAQRLFSDLADSILSNPSNPEYLHNAAFLHVEPYTPNHQMRERRQTSLESQTATDTDDENPSEPSPNYQGGYILSFAVTPLNAGVGWVIGFGRRSNKLGTIPGMVDLLLAKPGTSSSKFGVAGKHARLFFDKDAILTLKVFSSRGNATALGNEEFAAGQRSVITRKSRVSFGSLSYSLEFTDLDQDKYNSSLRNFVEAYLNQAPTSSDMSAAPSPMDTLVGEWNIRGTVGSGSFGVVNAAKNIKTGESGAAKCVIRNSLQTHAKILREIDILKALPRNPRLLYHFAEYYERGERWYTGIFDESDERYYLQTRPEKVIIICGPFARFNLSEALFLEQPLDIRFAAFYQVLQGLVALHDEGFIHRDIKPSNIGVVRQTVNMIEVVILDYGETIRSQCCEPRPGHVGTVPFLAPEMEQQSYGKEVDLWAAGVVGIQFFISQGKLPWRNVVSEEARWRRQMVILQSEPANSVQNLLASMLAWNPAERVLANMALVHPCFEENRIACDIEEQQTPKLGSKRNYTR